MRTPVAPAPRRARRRRVIFQELPVGGRDAASADDADDVRPRSAARSAMRRHVSGWMVATDGDDAARRHSGEHAVVAQDDVLHVLVVHDADAHHVAVRRQLREVGATTAAVPANGSRDSGRRAQVEEVGSRRRRSAAPSAPWLPRPMKPARITCSPRRCGRGRSRCRRARARRHVPRRW